MLTDREQEVLRLICKGYHGTEIAKLLFVTIHTVKAHISSILRKLNVKTQAQAVHLATRDGLV